MLFAPHLTLSLGCICWLFISHETLQHLSLSRTCQLPPSGTKSPRERGSIPALPGPCIPTISSMSSLFRQSLGTAVCHGRILCLNTTNAQTQGLCVSCLQLKKAGSAGTRGIHECACASTSALLSQLKRGKEPWLPEFVFCASPAHRSCGKPHLIRGTLCTPCQHPQRAVPLSLGRSGMLSPAAGGTGTRQSSSSIP